MGLHHHLQRIDRAYFRMHRNDDWVKRGHRCAYCLDTITREELTGDHRKARKHGGTTSKKNISASCRPCNHAKGHMTEKAFKKQLRQPISGCSWGLFHAHIRFRLNRRTEQACRRIRECV